MKAMPNKGVARLTIGIDTNAAITAPGGKNDRGILFAHRLGFRGRTKPHRASSKYSRPNSHAVAIEECDESRAAGDEHETASAIR